MTEPTNPVPDVDPIAVAAERRLSVPESTDDMTDSAQEISFWSPLPLAECVPIEAAFRTVDAAAIDHQLWHRRFTLIAAAGGYGSLLVAIWTLGFRRLLAPGLEHSLVVVELLLILAGGVALGVGLHQRRKFLWITNRHQAELLRLAKFEFVTTPSVWVRGPAARLQWVSDRIEKIRLVRGRHDLERAVSTATPETDPTDVPVLATVVLRTLVEYYRNKRLSPQRAYLANRAQKNAFWDGPGIRSVTTFLFFGSVVAVVIQAVINLWGAASDFWSVAVTTLGAASLPVAAAIIRTLRSAFEFSRNRSRFLATEDALRGLDDRLTHRLIWEGSTEVSAELASVTLQDLGRCEVHLRNEHQEWLRLMLEAEWFA